jgi:hypothetical protein
MTNLCAALMTCVYWFSRPLHIGLTFS